MPADRDPPKPMKLLAGVLLGTGLTLAARRYVGPWLRWLFSRGD